jgi:xylulokinase
MEGVTLEMRDILTRWWQEGMTVKALRLGGGATRSRLWTQIQADVYGYPVQTLQVEESTVLGAALLGGVGAGVFRSVEEGVAGMVHVTGEMIPQPEHRTIYDNMYATYVSAYAGLSQHVFDQLDAIQAAP